MWSTVHVSSNTNVTSELTSCIKPKSYELFTTAFTAEIGPIVVADKTISLQSTTSASLSGSLRTLLAGCGSSPRIMQLTKITFSVCSKSDRWSSLTPVPIIAVANRYRSSSRCTYSSFHYPPYLATGAQFTNG